MTRSIHSRRPRVTGEGAPDHWAELQRFSNQVLDGDKLSNENPVSVLTLLSSLIGRRGGKKVNFGLAVAGRHLLLLFAL